MADSFTLSVSPQEALIDTPRSIRLAGLLPHEAVTVAAQLRDASGNEWRSEALFNADADGQIDVDRVAPLSGSYQGVDGSGLLWSLAVQVAGTSPANDESAATRTLSLTAVSSGGAQAECQCVQILKSADVTREVVLDDGLSGVLYRAAGPGPHPAVIVLNGSGGGINEGRAALFASRGYDAFALGYFRAPGRPDYISGTPLEYFAKAMQWLRKTVQPANDFIALVGHSRGAELSLLLGSIYGAAVSAIVGYVPSTVIHGTLRAGFPGEDPAAVAWTLNGEALPIVWHDNRTADWSAFNSKVSPVRQSPSFVTALGDPHAVARARIPVEKVQAPILLITGTDDGFWPSSAMADTLLTELSANGFAFELEHLCYAGAGHAIQYPCVPTTSIVKRHTVAQVDLTGGGTPEANAMANADSWPKVLAFLARACSSKAQQQ